MDATVKKALIFMGVFAAITASVFLIFNLIFKRPNHHDEARWGTVHLQMAEGPNGFSQHHQEVVRGLLPELNRLGPTFIVGGEGDRSIRILNVDLTSGHPGVCDGLGNGRWIRNVATGEAHAEIDPACAHGDMEFQTTVMHEVGHGLGMQHICRIGESRTDCSPVGKGPAVMNSSLVVDRGEEIGFDHVYTGTIPTFEVQDLDIKEFERVNRPR